jgi:phosphatidylserine decarboxylase
MGEVSSNIFLDHIKPNYRLKKGEELGYFQFGGSTHCMIFRPGSIKSFSVEAPSEKMVLLSSHVATAN